MRLLFLLALFPSAAFAADMAVVVTTCGTPPGTYTAGETRPMLQDTTGVVCTSATGGGGTATSGNQTSQITQETAINTVLGLKTDAKNSATDATSITQMQVLKQVSFSSQAIATSVALGATAANQVILQTAIDTINSNISTIMGRLPTALCAGGAAVCNEVLDQAGGHLNYTPPATGAITSVAAATSSTTCLASNANRGGMAIENDSDSVMYLAAANVTVSSTTKTKTVEPHGYWEPPPGNAGVYTGIVKCIWVTATGSARVTEWTP